MTDTKRFLKSRVKDLLWFLAIAVVTTGVVVLLMLRSERNLAKGSIHNTAQRAATDFRRQVGGVEGLLRSARQYGVDPADIDVAQHYFDSSVFPNIGTLSGISLAQQGGQAFYLLRDGSRIDVRANGDYDPEQRRWFQGALDRAGADGCYWTDIYEFRTGQVRGISVSLSWAGGDGRPVVAAYDIPLDDFFKAVQELAPTPSSRVFIFAPGGSLYMPRSDETSPADVDATGGEELVREGLKKWNGGFRSHDSADIQVDPVRIKGKGWWCGFVPLTDSDRAVWMGIMVPKSDLVEDVTLHRIMYAGIGLIVIVAIGVIYLIYFKRLAGPRFALPPEADRVRAMIDQGENSTVEFKSTMRMNLHSKKPGKEIEHAWLKGVAAFLNTNGGTLLLGVTDDGEIGGLELDVFENDDKCRLHFKNLIAKGLGADVSKFIRFALVPMEGKTVGVVQCLKSSRPVYLRDGNKEIFYIRNGPSSDELLASRMVDYIAENWK